jgi:hypothetical protein
MGIKFTRTTFGPFLWTIYGYTFSIISYTPQTTTLQIAKHLYLTTTLYYTLLEIDQSKDVILVNNYQFSQIGFTIILMVG